MSTARERDERRILRFTCMRARGHACMERWRRTWDRKKQKRGIRLLKQANRLEEIRRLKFEAVRARGEWPK